MIREKYLLLLVGISAAATFGIFSVPSIEQDSAYHSFADNRNFLHIPNFFNVVSNLPFVVIGIAGIYQLSIGKPKLASHSIKMILLVFFAGLVMTGLGSGFYHYHPDNFTLVWDRLPLTVSFTAFFCLVVAECISTRIAIRLLPWLVVAGVLSVCYWYFSELNGQGDLRFYILVQYLPVVLIPLILWLYNSNAKGCAYIWSVLGAYVLAKIAESFDTLLYQHLVFISGHTIKHLLASIGTYFVYLKLTENPNISKVK